MTHIAHCIRRSGDREDVYTGSETLTAVPPYTLPRSSDDLKHPPRPDSRSSIRSSRFSPKYQLWPVSPPPPQKSPIPLSPVSYFRSFMGSDRKATALSAGRSASSLSDTAVTQESSAPLWPKQQSSGDLCRRRKISVPELTHSTIAPSMIKVSEGMLDSPTIPGRPPLRRMASDMSMLSHHERSNSVPTSSWRANPFGDALLSAITGPAPYENTNGSSRTSRPTEGGTSNYTPPPMTSRSTRPLSPILSPTVFTRPRPALKLDTTARIKEELEDTPPAPPPKSPSTERKRSPGPKFTSLSARPVASTPLSATAVTGPLSARPAISSVSTTNSTLPSAKSLLSLETSISPKFIIPLTQLQPMVPASASVISSKDWPAASPPLDSSKQLGVHSRNASENSVMGRGRPPKRSLSRKRSNTESDVRTSPTSEQWQLPVGNRPAQASQVLKPSDVITLRQQATEQAEKFEVMSKKDVTALSRELRALDERCEYLRRTYKSLREGRQKLHGRMLTYLKRNDTVIFSRESLLKQEEALAELDTSIDDWIVKLEQAENRRLRVRQKLLEHVAAALILQAPATSGDNGTTPPRSPIKVDSPAAAYEENAMRSRENTESIKIYADGRALNLFADIEHTIGQMCETH